MTPILVSCATVYRVQPWWAAPGDLSLPLYLGKAYQLSPYHPRLQKKSLYFPWCDFLRVYLS